MRIDLSCPVELWHCKIPTPDEPVCVMQMYNLSEKTVSSLQMCILCFDEAGEQFARQVERVKTRDALSQHAFEISVESEEGAQAHDLEILTEKVWFEDGTVWRRGEHPLTAYQPSPALSGGRLQVMQELAGADACCFPSDQGTVWVCVCGRPNAAGEEACSRCGREKHDVFFKLNQAAVENIIIKRESAREEKERRER